MATILNVVRWATNAEEFRRNLEQGLDQIEAVTKSADRMARAFGGEKVIAQAHNMAAALERVGGVSKLTEAEQARVNRTVESALEKYSALGREAPQALHDLAVATKQAEEKTSLLTRGAQALIAAFSVRAVWNATQDVLDFTGKLSDLSGKTGMGVEALQRLAYVTNQSGVSLEQVASGAVKFGRSLVDGNEAAATAVQSLGLNVQKLIQAGPERAFLAIGEAIAKVPNPMEQAALATALFGKSGADYLPAFTTNMEQLARQAQDSGAILSEDMVAAGDQAGDALGRLQGVGMALLAKVIVPLLPSIEQVANMLGAVLPAALEGARSAVDWLIRKGAELNVWLFDTAVAVAQTVRDVPVLGQVFGQSATDIESLRLQAQFAHDALNAFNAQGVAGVEAGARAAAPLVTGFGEAMQSAGRHARQAKTEIGTVWGEIGNIVRFQIAGVLNPTLVDLATNTSNAADAMQEVNDELERMQGNVVNVLPPLQNIATLPWAQFKQSVQQTGTQTEGFFSKVFGDSQTFGANISAIFQGAFEGGGGATGAVKSFATQAVGSLLGMVPVVGPFISQFAGPIVAGFSKIAGKVKDMFSGLFGGASKDEKEGRGLVAEFEKSIQSVLTSTQLAEAGNENWAKTVIAIRDAYIAMGRTEAEALKDAERLWASSKQGAEASRTVIDEITIKMKEQASVADTVGEATSEAFGTAAESGETAAGAIHDAMARAMEQTRVAVESGSEGTRAAAAVAIEEAERLAAAAAGQIGQTAARGVTAIDKLAGALQGLPDVVNFELRGTYRTYGEPGGAEGYASGTLGMTGAWFKDFGVGRTVRLHGKEAVVTEQQAPKFAAAFGAGDNAGSVVLGRIERHLRNQHRVLARAISHALAAHGVR